MQTAFLSALCRVAAKHIALSATRREAIRRRVWLDAAAAAVPVPKQTATTLNFLLILKNAARFKKSPLNQEALKVEAGRRDRKRFQEAAPGFHKSRPEGLTTLAGVTREARGANPTEAAVAPPLADPCVALIKPRFSLPASRAGATAKPIIHCVRAVCCAAEACHWPLPCDIVPASRQSSGNAHFLVDLSRGMKWTI